MKNIKSAIRNRKRFAAFAAAAAICFSMLGCQVSYAGWAFGDYDQDWEDINHTFVNYKPVGMNGRSVVYQSNKSSKKNTWSRAWESHEFGDYSIAVCGDSINLFYTRDSGANWDRDLVMKMNFSLYRSTHPDCKYTFQVKVYDGSDNDGRLDQTGYLTELRYPEGGNLIPASARRSTLSGIEYMYPAFFLDFNSLAEALSSGVWFLSLDSMQVYDD